MIAQKSAEWFHARTGMITASQFHRVMNATDKGLRTLAAEIRASLNGETPRTFSSAATDWGNQHEPQARALFEFQTGLEVKECGLIVHPEHFFIGASPDALLEPDGILEIKCPFDPANHDENARCGIPPRHVAQVQGQLFVTGRKHAYFVSFDPRRLAAGEYALHIEKVKRDDAYIAKLEARILRFWQEYVVNEAAAREAAEKNVVAPEGEYLSLASMKPRDSSADKDSAASSRTISLDDIPTFF